MKPCFQFFLILLGSAGLGLAQPLGTSFTFQGRLDADGKPADGVFDLSLSLYDVAAGGTPVAAPVDLPAESIVGGLFSADLDFGGQELFDGTAYWLEISVTKDGVASVVPDRIPIRPTPYSIHARNAASVTDGAVGSDALANGAVTRAKVSARAIGTEHISVPSPPAAGQMLTFDGENLAWATPADGGGGAGPAPWILSGPQPYLTWLDTLTNRGASISSADGSLYFRVPRPDGSVVTAGYVDHNGMVTRGRLSVEADDPVITWDDQGVRSHISSASGSLYFRLPRPDGSLTTAAFVDHQGVVTNGRFFAQGDVTASRLVLRADPDSPNNAAVLCFDAGVTNFVPYNKATNRALNLVVNDATARTLTILGGADLAEPFAMSHEGVEPGTVVVIDENNPGKLRRSLHPYDKKVAGIVSGADGIQPGISMIQEDQLEAGKNVALCGRVYVKANADGGPILPGDMLTTSDTPGEAMKAADLERAQGAILGKAMSALGGGSGTVLVLVTLQ